jgi:Protein of unknown function (DUF3455)
LNNPESGEEMSNNPSQQTRKIARVRNLFAAALVLGCALGTVTNASAQKIASPKTPDAITPPAGNTAFLVGHAYGTQGYTCLPTSTGGTAWNTNARPEATLFVDVFGKQVQIITHFASIDTNPNDFAPKPVSLSGNATWQSSFDTSKVWAVKTGQIDAGTDSSCPNNGAIPCLLLQSIGNQEGPTDCKLLANVTFIQRLYTKAGAAPTTACSVGQTQLQPYEADYYFFRAGE